MYFTSSKMGNKNSEGEKQLTILQLDMKKTKIYLKTKNKLIIVVAPKLQIHSKSAQLL
jgi:hypothetical protein